MGAGVSVQASHDQIRTVAAIAISAVDAQPAMATAGPRRKDRMTDLFVAISIMATMIGTFRRFWKRFLRHVLPSRRHLPPTLERSILTSLAAIAYRFLDCCSPEYDHVICGRALPVAVWSIVPCLFTTQQTR